MVSVLANLPSLTLTLNPKHITLSLAHCYISHTVSILNTLSQLCFNLPHSSIHSSFHFLIASSSVQLLLVKKDPNYSDYGPDVNADCYYPHDGKEIRGLLTQLYRDWAARKLSATATAALLCLCIWPFRR
jgi:hypothetical protein